MCWLLRGSWNLGISFRLYKCNWTKLSGSMSQLCDFAQSRRSGQDWTSSAWSSSLWSSGQLSLLKFQSFSLGIPGELLNKTLKSRPSQRTDGVRHEMSSSTQTRGSWAQIPFEACISVRCFCVFVVLGTGLATGYVTRPKSPTDCRIWGSHSGRYENCHLLGYSAMWFVCEPTFLRNFGGYTDYKALYRRRQQLPINLIIWLCILLRVYQSI
jgi:hypothetical protein